MDTWVLRKRKLLLRTSSDDWPHTDLPGRTILRFAPWSRLGQEIGSGGCAAQAVQPCPGGRAKAHCIQADE